MKIPSNKQWTQDNSGDTFGILGETTNMAMDMNGRARLANKSVAIFDSREDNGFGIPLAINYFDSKYLVLTSNDIFDGNFPGNGFTDAGTGANPSFGFYSDAVVFNSLYTVSVTNTIYTLSGTTWTDRSASLTSGINHPLEVFGTQLAVGNGNTVKLFTTSYTLAQTLTLPTEYRVVTMRAVGNYLYIGTKNLNGSNAKIFVWNGDSSAYDYECEVGASWVFSMTPYLSTVAAITSQGQLGVVNGTTFEELAGLPVYYNPHARWTGSTGLTLNGKVFNRGMATIGGTIYINIEGEVDSGFMPEMKSGLWVYDPDVGLYHRAGATEDKYVEDSSLSRSGDVLTTSAAHKLKTGDAVVFDVVSGLTGVDHEVKYYVTVISATEIKLSQSRKAVKNGVFITLGGTPTAGDTLCYCQNNDYGTFSTTSGAVVPATYLETPHPNLTTEVLWGARMELIDGTTEYGLFSFCDSYNIGQFATQRIYSDNIKQDWKELYNFIDGLFTESEEVVVKAQTKYEPKSLSLSGVWLDTSTLNNASASDYSAFMDIEEGYELVFIDGYGRGRTAHVVTKNTSSSTVSLVLDEAIGTTNGSSTFYYTTYKKVGENLDSDKKVEELTKSLVSNSSSWVSIKVELRGHDLSISTMELSNAVNKGTN